MSHPRQHKKPECPKDILEAYHFTQPWQVRFWPLVLVLLVVVICLSSLVAVEAVDFFRQGERGGNLPSSTAAASTNSNNSPKGYQVAGGVLALGAFLVGYHQWRAARRETSMDRFYDRLKIANDNLAKLEDTNPFHMYVFSELDNLEYVIEKYRLGYMSPDQALRGLRTFQSRLKQPKGQEFADSAEVALVNSAYSPSTCAVVRRVIEETMKDSVKIKSYSNVSPRSTAS